MTTWLHFVGRSYYKSATRFVREAQHYGVTRRVSLAVLKQMSWGDRVLLAQLAGVSGVIFGQFTITKLSGFSADGAAAFAKALGDRVEVVTYPAPRRVERGCGSYVVHGEARVRDCTVAEVTAALSGVENVGKLMVGGTFEPLDVGWVTPLVDGRVRLKDVPHSQGFRPFAYDEFKSEVVAWLHTRPGKVPGLRGFFYAKTDHARAVADGIAELVDDYRRGSHYEQGDLEL
jgi:hypothetical protein